MTVNRKLLLFLGMLGLVVFAGCRGRDLEPTAAEVDEYYYRQGQAQKRQERMQEALASFLKVIEKRGEQGAPQSHLEAGTIYLYHSKDPIEAYHHFRIYLAQEPNSQTAVRVRELIETAKKEFAKTLPGQPIDRQSGRLDLLEQNEKLQREIQDLRAENYTLRNGAGSPVLKSVRAPINLEQPVSRASPAAPVTVSAAEDDSPITAAPMPSQNVVTAAAPPPTGAPATRPNASAPPAPASTVRTAPARPGTQTPTSNPAASAAGRRHTVAQGEGLWAIARKYYGTPTAANTRAILDANRGIIKSESDLRPGMVLQIP